MSTDPVIQSDPTGSDTWDALCEWARKGGYQENAAWEIAYKAHVAEARQAGQEPVRKEDFSITIPSHVRAVEKLIVLAVTHHRDKNNDAVQLVEKYLLLNEEALKKNQDLHLFLRSIRNTLLRKD